MIEYHEGAYYKRGEDGTLTLIARNDSEWATILWAAFCRDSERKKQQNHFYCVEKEGAVT